MASVRSKLENGGNVSSNRPGGGFGGFGGGGRQAAGRTVAEDFRVAGAGDAVVEAGKAATLGQVMTPVTPGVVASRGSLALSAKPTG